MSRRTKLTALAIFLVLVGIPASYVVLAWHPPNPLRFRVVHVFPDDTLHSGSRLLRIRIENTSITPVEFEHAVIDPRSDLLTGGSGSIDVQFQFDGKKVHLLSPPTIPPFGTVELNAVLQEDLVDEAQQGILKVSYAWRSQILMKENEIRDWFHEHVPFFRKKRLKYLPPYDWDTTVLEN